MNELQMKLSKELGWFLRVLDGETLSDIARAADVTTSTISRHVAKVARRMRHPRFAIPGEVHAENENLSAPDWYKKNKAFYLARLVPFCAFYNIQPKAADKRPPVLQIPQWTPELDAKIGSMSDTALAKQLSASTHVVRKRRLALGIESFGSRLDKKLRVAKQQKEDIFFKSIQWPAELLADLGKRFDHYLAKKYKIPKWAVRRKRASLGITEAPFSHLYD